MDLEGSGPAVAARGRVVMLVDNAVHGDSRVQKSARSAADAGWEVILLGKAPQGEPGRSQRAEPETWRLGGALVRLLQVPQPLDRPRADLRRSWRWPLAYPPSGIAEQRAQAVRAWRADLRTREALLTIAARSGREGPALAARRAALRCLVAAAGIARKWVSFRYWQLTRARKGRRPNGRWNRAYTRFWQAVGGDRCWRRLQPGLWDYELAYGPVIDELAPDLIHANDFRMLGVGARAAIRARAAGRQVKLVWDAHEFLPGIRPWRNDARWLPAHRAYEREYAPYADAVVTVSNDLAEMIRKEHGLAELPTVVLNAPARADATSDVRAVPSADVDPTTDAASAEAVPELRARCGVGAADPLLVYSGMAAEQRGLSTMVEALPRLPGVHVALVVNKATSRFMLRLLARASELGASDRVHVLPYVPHWQVVRFLASADAGVIPIHHWPNHEIALITKFFEYSHARLPVIVSDVRTMAETVRSTGQGEVFRAQDVDDYVRAVQAVLADPARYRAAYERPGLLAGWTWEAQAEVLDGVYRRLLPGRDGLAPASTPAGGAAAATAVTTTESTTAGAAA